MDIWQVRKMPQSINDKDGDILSPRSWIPKRWHSFLKIVSSIILMSSYWFVYIRVYRSEKYDIVNSKSFFFFKFEVVKFSVRNIYNLYVFILRAFCAISLKYLEYKIY